MNGQTDGQMNESALCSTELHPLWGRCPASPNSYSQSCKAGQWVSVTTYCPWATCYSCWFPLVKNLRGSMSCNNWSIWPESISWCPFELKLGMMTPFLPRKLYRTERGLVRERMSFRFLPCGATAKQCLIHHSLKSDVSNSPYLTQFSEVQKVKDTEFIL